MTFSLTTAALLAGAAATAIAMAPAAAADGNDRGSGSSSEAGVVKPGAGAVKPSARQNPLTRDFNSAQIPQGWKNDAIWARPVPGTSDSTFGRGPRPPVLALD